MKRLVVLLWLLLPIYLQAQVTVGPGTPLIEELKSRALSQGRVLPFSVYPQPLSTLKKIFAAYSSPDEEKSPYFRDGLYGRTIGSVQVTGRVSGPRDSFWDSYLLYGLNSDPFLVCGLGVQDEERFGLFMNGEFSQEFSGWEPTNLYWPKPDNLFPLENHFLTQGYLWYNFDPLTVQIGRDKLHYGPFDSSLVVSSRMPFFDMVRVNIPMGDWNFDWVVATPETRTSSGTDVNTTVLMTQHRMEYGFPFLRVAWSESYIVQRGPTAGPPGPFFITDVLPFYFLHQADMAPNNVAESIDVNWAVMPGWALLAALAYDDINAAYTGMPDYGTPTIWAFMLGTDIQWKSGDLDWKFHGEMGMTHYLYGNYEDAYPLAKARYLLLLDPKIVSLPLNSPYGPGATWLDTRTLLTFKPFEVELKTNLWNIRDGVSQDSIYEGNPSLEGFGTIWNYRADLEVRWSFLTHGTLSIQGGILGRNADMTAEGSLSVKWAYDTAPLP